jgi:hypothetical protein
MNLGGMETDLSKIHIETEQMDKLHVVVDVNGRGNARQHFYQQLKVISSQYLGD